MPPKRKLAAVDSEMVYAVAQGDVTGVFLTLAEATAAAGAHAVPLIQPCDNDEKASKFMDAFKGAHAVVYTDGACSNNGRAAAAGGVGVFWGVSHRLNVSRPVHGASTNNVAELEAIEDALTQIGKDSELASKKVVIVTDSLYSIKAVTVWYDGFAARHWSKVKNVEIIQRIHAALEALPGVVFVHVRGHVGHVGNEQADELARAGGLVAPTLDLDP
jgi:ribonuclease HI